MRLRSTRSAGREGCHEAEKTHAHGRSDSGSACHVRAGKPTAAAYGHSRHQAGAFQYFYTLHHGNARPRLGFRAVFDARHARLRYHRAGLGIFIQLRGRALRVCAHASTQDLLKLFHNQYTNKLVLILYIYIPFCTCFQIHLFVLLPFVVDMLYMDFPNLLLLLTF